MLIRKFGIILSTVQEEDIELIRIKRNSDAIRNNMAFREIITPEMQAAWYRNLHTAIDKGDTTSFYFLITYNGEKIGLINGKNIDFKQKTSEGGFFIWESKYWGSMIPVMISIITLDYSFLLNDFYSNHIKVLKSNAGAIQFNRHLGYEIRKEDEDSFYFILTREKYLSKADTFRKIIGRETGDAEPLNLSSISFEDTGEEELKKIGPLLQPLQRQQILKILELNGRKIF
jgi:RimJ/RimL family protein N-acetyltransferase